MSGAPKKQNVFCEVCILAGGLSERMGRDKSQLRLGRKTLLGHIRAIAEKTNLPVRVIRRDLISRCGPLGGIYTALKTTRADAVLFLACDMPFLSEKLLADLLKRFTQKSEAMFVHDGETAGFPFLLRLSAFATVEKQLAAQEFSIQKLAGACGAKMFPARARKEELFNLNTPADWDKARQVFQKKS